MKKELRYLQVNKRFVYDFDLRCFLENVLDKQ